MKEKLIALLLAAALCVSMVPAAVAAPTDVVDAKDDLATIDIVQACNTTQSDKYTHDYTTDGDDVTITYSASLAMTEEMAIYLQARQSQLLNAKFNVHVMIDTEEKETALDFVEEGDTLTITMASSFLKPWGVDGDDIRTYKEAFVGYKDYAYDYKLVKVEDGMFHYEIYVDKAWAQTRLNETGYMDIPLELVVYYDGTDVYSFEDLPAAADSEKPVFYDYTAEDWMRASTVTCSGLRVKDSVPANVTYNEATWRRVTACGTVDGEFTYEKAHKISTIRDYRYANNTTTLEFGNDFSTGGSEDIIEEWTSDTVWVYLIRSTPYNPGEKPDSPFLNQDDHFAYVIGMPDGLVHPEMTITRAEVATIFFRMLTDEVRNEFWTQANPYYDVQITDWYNNAISTLSNLGVVNGMPDGGFHPTDNITRGEFATMAVRFFLITEDMYEQVEEDAFSDIAGHWANEYINMAYLLEIVSGYPDGTFRPGKAIDRAEAMTIVNNTLRRTPCNEGIETVEKHEDFIIWPDNMDKSKWYYAAVQEATNSHEYTTYTQQAALNGKELWTNILPVRDWAAFERAWSDANSASNPGEVVSGN